jgi:hypothetical protein
MTSCPGDFVTPFVRWCVRHRVNVVTGVNVVNVVTGSEEAKGSGDRDEPGSFIAARRAPPTLVATALRPAGKGTRNGFANGLVYPTRVRCAHARGHPSYWQ